MSASAGRVILMAKGDYSGSATYNALDWVRYSNAAWVCKENNVTNVVPSTTASQWQLLVADSAFSNLGDLMDVSITSEQAYQFLGCMIDTSTNPATITWENMSADVVYTSTSAKPISGAGVADALSNYYTKTEIGLDEILKYKGTKTANQLTASSNPLLIAANRGNYYRASSSGTTTSDYVQGSGRPLNTGDHVAVIETSTGVYKFDIINFVDISGKADKTKILKYSAMTMSSIGTIGDTSVEIEIDQSLDLTTDYVVIPFSDPNICYTSMSYDTLSGILTINFPALKQETQFCVGYQKIN